MEVTQALGIIKPLSDGIDPFTGEEFPFDSPYQNPQVIRALYLAVSALEKEKTRVKRQDSLPTNAGKPWSIEEDNELVKTFDSGKSLKELSDIYQRTERAIQSRLIKLGKIQLPV
ncbi:MAG: hypothetical protein DRP45_06910 [Candidatus Zixiibacteriota bacterium]|nr:MAG: hypothetical protein DRP45_06910 [candidate division Zixibacteria bacterium]